MGRLKDVFYSAHSASQFSYNWKRNESVYVLCSRILEANQAFSSFACALCSTVHLLLQYESGVSVYYLPFHMCIYVMNKYMEYNSKLNENKLCNAKTRSGGVWVNHNVSYSARLFADKDSSCSLLLLRHHRAIFNPLYTLYLNRLLILPKNF